jgi:hypothetical protein
MPLPTSDEHDQTGLKDLIVNLPATIVAKYATLSRPNCISHDVHCNICNSDGLRLLSGQGHKQAQESPVDRLRQATTGVTRPVGSGGGKSRAAGGV